MSREDRRRVRRMVERWAGDGVEVLVIDSSEMELYVDRAKQLCRSDWR